jgi:hypothetical protein
VPDGNGKVPDHLVSTVLLPNSMADQITGMVDGGCEKRIKKTLTE